MAPIDTPDFEANPETVEYASTAGGAAAPTPIPFFFAWVDASQSTWTYAMARWDEKIIDMELKHEEGQIPTLDITIKNPRIGLLAPGRYQWAWFAYQSPKLVSPNPIPLFFGELVGVPANLFAETITLKFIARSMDYIALKQAIAETLKIPGNYDPIFLDESHRDDPDAILEGWSSMYHVDRTTLAVSASDVLEGEDGTITFLPPAGKLGSEFVLYDSVNLSLGEAPLTNVQVEASVHWTQRSQGYVDGPNVNVQTYTGDTFMGDWPKPGKSLGGGWTVETSFVNDVYKIGLTPNYSMSNTTSFYSNPGMGQTGIFDYDCATASESSSISGPALLTPSSMAGTIVLSWQEGICRPSDASLGSAFGASAPVNIPMSIHGTGVVVPLWVLNCSWNLRYNAKREYTEDVTLNITANTQSVLTSPTVEQDTKLIKVTGEVGQPLIIYDAWTDFADKPVGEGQLIFPNDPTTPGGLAYQVCVTAGTCGTTEPVFSDIPGTLTGDNGVGWASLGESPLSAIQNMTFATQYDIGTILLYQEQQFDTDIGELTDIIGATSYWLVTEPNTATTSTYTEVIYIPPVTSSDEPTPAPVTTFVEVFEPSSSDANYLPPPVVGSGTLISMNGPTGPGAGKMIPLGTQPAFLGIPVGGTANNVTANNYFPTPRGRQSVEYLVNKARAQLRWRSRAVKISFDCSFDFLAQMNPSCRKNATVYDPRLPGGVATGKIISYGFTAKDGEMLGHVEIGCAVGYGGSISAITGTSVYASAGYMQSDYQQMEGSVYTLSEEDIGYTPPSYAPFDDGLIFPLNNLPCDGGVFSGTSGCPGQGQILATVINPGGMGGSGPLPVIDPLSPTTALATIGDVPIQPGNLSGQALAIYQGIVTDLLLLAYSTPPQPAVNGEGGVGGEASSTTGSDATEAWKIAMAYFADTMENLPYVMEANPITWEMEIDPVTNGPFSGAYTVICTELEVPQGINLNAPSFDE